MSGVAVIRTIEQMIDIVGTSHRGDTFKVLITVSSTRLWQLQTSACTQFCNIEGTDRLTSASLP